MLLTGKHIFNISIHDALTSIDTRVFYSVMSEARFNPRRPHEHRYWDINGVYFPVSIHDALTSIDGMAFELYVDSFGFNPRRPNEHRCRYI